MLLTDEIIKLKDDENALFQAKLTPGIDAKAFLGVRVPELRKLEKKYRNTKESREFLEALPHRYFDENLLHGIIISNLKDYDEVLVRLQEFIPYIDNWCVCDTTRPAVFKKKKEGLLENVKKWISGRDTYEIRFGVDMLMTYYLDADFKPEYLELPAKVESDEYYVKMMIAWYYATALAKQWEDTIPYITEKRLSPWVHNKTIQKAVESYRITDEQKRMLRSYKL